jgi:peptide/nickel transport system substrate-binding protein
MILSSADPARAFEAFQLIAFRGIYDSLLTVDALDPGKLLPMLATQWDVAPDAASITVKLRPNVKFVTGGTMTSDDVRWSFERVKNVKSSPATFTDSIKSIETPDPLTVKFNLTDPDTSYLAALSSTNLSILDSTFMKTKGASAESNADQTDKGDEWLNNNSAGTGPYVMTEWTHDSQMTLKRFPGSYRPAVFNDVIFKTVPDAATQKLMLDRGDADIALDLLPEQIETFRSGKTVSLAEAPLQAFFHVGFTRRPEMHPALPKPEVGYAIRYAIDYAGIRSLAPKSVTPPSIVPLGLVGALDPAKDGITTDVKKAKDLLSAAGYPDGFEAKLTFNSTFIFGGVKASVLAQKIQSDLAQIGIQLTLEPLEPAVLSQRNREANNQMLLGAYIGDYPDAGDWLPLFQPGGTIAKRIGWLDTEHPTYKLGTQALRTVDPDKRKQLYEDAQRAMLMTGPFAVLVQPVQTVAYRADLKGVVSNPMWWSDVAAISRG